MKKFAAQLKFSNLLTSLCLPLYKILWIMPVVQSSITYILSQIIGNRYTLNLEYLVYYIIKFHRLHFGYPSVLSYFIDVHMITVFMN